MSGLENSIDSPQGHKESDTTEQLRFTSEDMLRSSLTAPQSVTLFENRVLAGSLFFNAFM